MSWNDETRAICRSVLQTARKMRAEGLVVASAGNVSAAVGGSRIAITPTSVPYDVMTEDQIVLVDVATGQTVDSGYRPSYELPMHLAIYRARQDVGAIVHTHAPFVTTLSILRRSLPPVIDEMMLWFGGEVKVADYAFTGTDAVGRNVVRALGDRAGAILSNHGNVCVGKSLDEALHVAIAMESAARAYVQALSVGFPKRLPDDAIRKGRELFDRRRGSRSGR